MQYAAADWIGILIVVGVIAFQVIGKVIEASKTKESRPARPASEPEPPRPQQSPPPQSGEDFGSLDDLLEALGHKPKKESRAPQVPASERARTWQQPPVTPSPVFVPTRPAQAQPQQKKATPPPVPQVVLPPREPEPVMRSLEEEMGNASTAETQAQLTRDERKPVFVTGIDSIVSASAAPRRQTADHQADALSAVLGSLRNRTQLRRAIITNEILSPPVALR